MKSLISSLPLPEIYYHGASTSYYREAEDKSWIRINEGNAQKFLIDQGYSRTHPSDLSEVDRALTAVQSKQNVGYVGSLAGYRAGPYAMNGKTILVNSSPRIIAPAEGCSSTIQGIVESVLKLEGCEAQNEQIETFHAWLKSGYSAVSKSEYSQSQALVIAGPVNAGKSLLQMLITKVLGGRSANPYQFMTGDTQFNQDLFEAEHLMVEDDSESSKIGDRRKFGNTLKSLSVNRNHRCHGKGKDGIDLTPIRRVSVSVNDNQERIQVLPPMSDDVDDKIILMKAHRRQFQVPTTTEDDKARLREAIDRELPAFIDFLMKQNYVNTRPDPKETVRRYGVFTYQNPEILRLLASTDPEVQMLELIDREIFRESAENWTGEAASLMQRLTLGTMEADYAKDLLKNSNRTGQYLGRLEVNPSYSNRVSKTVRNGSNIWTITPPPHRRRPTASSS